MLLHIYTKDGTDLQTATTLEVVTSRKATLFPFCMHSKIYEYFNVIYNFVSETYIFLFVSVIIEI